VPPGGSATRIFERHPECYDEETSELFRNGRDPCKRPGLRFTRQATESMALNQIKGGAIIMAGSGMCMGGRVRHHLRHHLGRSQSSVIFVGFAALGTLARRIIDGAQTVSIHGEEIRVRAMIHTINGFSAHADQAGSLPWQQTARPATTFLAHGDLDAMKHFAEHLKDTQVEMPKLRDEFVL
jgi:metallo-beta-lactamase family protein